MSLCINYRGYQSAFQIPMKIVADYREKKSGIPDILIQREAGVVFESLPAGDYIINGRITAERKSAEDFIQSIISNRLFEQCSRLKKTHGPVFLFIEGNPYLTDHKIEKQAVRGAILSVMISWQIPVIFSKNPVDSAELLLQIGKQNQKGNSFVRQGMGFKPKKLKNQQLRFLQGFPGTGPTLAGRLFSHFGSIKAVINADREELLNVKGIGKMGAEKILKFVDQAF